MVGRSASYLGMAISDQAITCAELSPAGGVRTAQRHSARRTATFVFPANASLDTPDATGQALAAFLRQKKFSSSRVIVGIPARWLIAVEKELPPADDQQARAALRLQVERLAVAESGEVVFDFAGNADTRQPTRVLLVGMLKQRLERIERLMDAAGMNVVAVTSTGLAMASAAATRSDDGGFLALNQGGGELVWRAGGGPRMLRHVPVALNGHEIPATAPLSAELRRMIAMAPTNGTVQSRSVLLLDGVGLSSEQVIELSERLGVSVRATGPADALGVDVSPLAATSVTAESESAGQGRLAPAMALAIAGAHSELLTINFKHSRLAPPRVRRLDSRAALGIAVVAAVFIAAVALFWIVGQRQGELDELNVQLAEMKAPVGEARNVVDRFNYGSGFFPGARPPVIECLRELTLSFRDSDQLWTTSFKLSADGKGTFTGKAADQKTVGDLLDRMRNNPRFSDVKVQDIREADARSREVTFAANFVFN